MEFFQKKLFQCFQTHIVTIHSCLVDLLAPDEKEEEEETGTSQTQMKNIQNELKEHRIHE